MIRWRHMLIVERFLHGVSCMKMAVHLYYKGAHTTSIGRMQFSHKIPLQTSAGEIFTLIVTVLMVESKCYSTVHSNLKCSITVLCRRSIRKATAGLYCLLHWCSIWMDCIYKLEVKLLPTCRRGWGGGRGIMKDHVWQEPCGPRSFNNI